MTNDDTKHVLIGTKGDTPLCALNVSLLTPELIIRPPEEDITCLRCRAITTGFRLLYGGFPASIQSKVEAKP